MTQLRRQGGSQPGGRSTGLGVRGTAWVLVLTPLTTSLLRNIHLGSTGSFISTLPFSEAVSLSHTNLQGSRFLTQGNIGELGRGKISTGKQRKQTLGPFHILPSLWPHRTTKGGLTGLSYPPSSACPSAKRFSPQGCSFRKQEIKAGKGESPVTHFSLNVLTPMSASLASPPCFCLSPSQGHSHKSPITLPQYGDNLLAPNPDPSNSLCTAPDSSPESPLLVITLLI